MPGVVSNGRIKVDGGGGCGGGGGNVFITVRITTYELVSSL